MDHNWTGTLLHKGKMISRICIKTAWPLPVPLEERLELNQKMTQSNFINKVMPSTVTGETHKSLSLDMPDIYEETVIQVGMVEPTDDTSKHIWTKFASFLSTSSSVGVSNMEGRGGHLFVAAPTNAEGPFESLFSNFHKQKTQKHTMCVIFLWETNYLRMSSLPDPWGDVITAECDVDDDTDVAEHKETTDNQLSTLAIKQEEKKKETETETETETEEEEDIVKTDSRNNNSSLSNSSVIKSSKAELAAADSTHAKCKLDTVKRQSSDPLASAEALSKRALAEEVKLSSGVNPPNPGRDTAAAAAADMKLTIDQKMSSNVEDVTKLAKSSSSSLSPKLPHVSPDAAQLLTSPMEHGRRKKHKQFHCSAGEKHVTPPRSGAPPKGAPQQNATPPAAPAASPASPAAAAAGVLFVMDAVVPRGGGDDDDDDDDDDRVVVPGGMVCTVKQEPVEPKTAVSAAVPARGGEQQLKVTCVRTVRMDFHNDTSTDKNEKDKMDKDEEEEKKRASSAASCHSDEAPFVSKPPRRSCKDHHHHQVVKQEASSGSYCNGGRTEDQRASRLNSGDNGGELPDADDITDNDIISAQLIELDDDDDTPQTWQDPKHNRRHNNDDSKPWQDADRHNGDVKAMHTPPEGSALRVRTSSANSTSSRTSGSSASVSGGATSTLSRFAGMSSFSYYKQKSSSSSSSASAWGSAQKKSRRSCTDSAFQVTIPGISSLRKQNVMPTESRDDDPHKGSTTADQRLQLTAASDQTVVAQSVGAVGADRVQSRPEVRPEVRPYVNGTDHFPDPFPGSLNVKPPAAMSLPPPPPPNNLVVICPQKSPPYMHERHHHPSVDDDSHRYGPPPPPMHQQDVGVWGRQDGGPLLADAVVPPVYGGRRSPLEINTIHILDGLAVALKNEACCRTTCASIVQALASLLKSNDALLSKDDQSTEILGMVDVLLTPPAQPPVHQPERTMKMFPSFEDAGRAFIQSRAQAHQKEALMEGQWKSQINSMIQQATSDIIKDLGLTTLRAKGTEMTKMSRSSPSPPSTMLKPAALKLDAKTLPPLKIVPVGCAQPFVRDCGYYSVGTRSINYLQSLWHSAYLTSKDGIDKLHSQLIIPLVGSIKRQKQGLVKEFGTDVYNGDLKRRPCRLYKEYDVLHAFFHFHKTVLLANVWFRSNYKEMMMPRLLFIQRKLLVQAKYVRQSRDLIQDALRWSEMMDVQLPLFHYAFNACIAFENRLEKKLAECRSFMQKRRQCESGTGLAPHNANINCSQLEDLDFDCEQKDHHSVSPSKRSDRDSTSRYSSTHSRGRTRSPSAQPPPPHRIPSPASPPRSDSSSSSNSSLALTSSGAVKSRWTSPSPVRSSPTASIDKLIKMERQKEERLRRVSADGGSPAAAAASATVHPKRESSAELPMQFRGSKRNRSPIRNRRTPSPFQPRRRSPSSGRKRSRSPLKPKRSQRMHTGGSPRRHSSEAGFYKREGMLKRLPNGIQLTHPTTPTAAMRKNYKTKLCINWLHHKKCVMGDTCSYAHGKEDLQKYRA